MKCSHCGAQLPETETPRYCIYCGRPLERPGKDGGLESVLAEIRERFGLDALRDGQRAVAYLADLAPALLRERELLRLFYESGCAEILLNAQRLGGPEREAARARAERVLTNERWLRDEAAEMVCDAFLYALCPEAAPEPEKPATPPVQPPKPAAKPQPAAPDRSGANPTRAAKKPGSVLEKVIAAVSVIAVIGLAVSFVIWSGTRTVTEGDYTFSVTEGDYTFSVTKESAVLIEYNGSDTLIEVPGEVNGRPVAEIGEGAFAGNQSIQRVTLPESVAVIGENAFAGCSELRILVSRREEETKVAATAFTGCEQLSAIYTPNSDTTWIPGETGMIHLT